MGCRKKKQRGVSLIDPKAYQIYSEKLLYYDENRWVPSSLASKVICLPYLFEKVLPFLKNNYLRRLTEGLGYEGFQHNAEIRGTKAEWIPAIRYYLDAEYTEKVEELLKKIGEAELEESWPTRIELYLKMAFNLRANKQDAEAEEYFEKFKNLLYLMMVERLGTSIVLVAGHRKLWVQLNFTHVRNATGGVIFIDLNLIRNVILGLSDFCAMRARLTNQADTKLEGVIEMIRLLREYLEPFKGDGCESGAYVKLRKDKISSINKFREYLELADLDNPDPHANPKIGVKLSKLHTEVIAEISEIEKNVLNQILKKSGN